MIRNLALRRMTFFVGTVAVVTACGLAIGFDKVGVWILLLGIAAVPLAAGTYWALAKDRQGGWSRAIGWAIAVGFSVFGGSFAAMLLDPRLGPTKWRYVVSVAAGAGVISVVIVVLGGLFFAAVTRMIAELRR